MRYLAHAEAFLVWSVAHLVLSESKMNVLKSQGVWFETYRSQVHKLLMEFLKPPQEVIRNDGISTNQRISLNINPLVVAPGQLTDI